MQNVLDTLASRGLVAQSTNLDALKKILSKEKIKFYIGFDGTADSLHVGHFIPIVLMKHMQNAGHTPIALLGTGTTLIGDPTGKSDMRKMLDMEEINKNAELFRRQISKYIDFSGGRAIVERNGDWLCEIKYIDMLREVGLHFSVNRMLAAECFKNRMERGLSFMEFNYMIMQSYDFLQLYRRHSCLLQMGGDDQWSNIIGGVELVRRKEGREVFGLTVPLLTTKEGRKMGKTEKGALWLDPDKTSPYDFFQYWRNIGDQDVINTMKFITFLPPEEIDEFAKLEDSDINKAKERLAFEVTKLIHGEDEAKKALSAAQSVFVAGGADANMPSASLSEEDFTEGKIEILKLLLASGLAPSRSEGRRLVTQGGIVVGGEKISDPAQEFEKALFEGEGVIVKKGKKVFLRVNFS
ncbi:MAG: tyrosine--tRNA ligase [Oscillospiraceae bacterium]|jgi:tyrosyl-tRNA synthetase|nr:tyrosine--tRNA ligase [Oscillospiraceae bacterium]